MVLMTFVGTTTHLCLTLARLIDIFIIINPKIKYSDLRERDLKWNYVLLFNQQKSLKLFVLLQSTE